MSVTETPLVIEVVDPVPHPGNSHAQAQTVSRAESAAPSIDPVIDAISDGLEQVGGLIERVARFMARRLDQIDVDGNPRRQSRVRHHVFAPYSDVVGCLPDDGSSWAGRGARIDIVSPFRAGPDGGHVADARLRLRGSWPALPLQISADPWWRDRTLITVTLRSQRRWRYPRRYYRGVHHSLRAMTSDWVADEEEWVGEQ